MSRGMAAPRLLTLLMSSFAVIGLLLTATGLYGLLLYAVSRRTREIGVRMALGASRGSIVSMILGRALTLITIGTVLGGAGLFAGQAVLKRMIFELDAPAPTGLAVRCCGHRRADGRRRRLSAGHARRLDRSDHGAASGMSVVTNSSRKGSSSVPQLLSSPVPQFPSSPLGSRPYARSKALSSTGVRSLTRPCDTSAKQRPSSVSPVGLALADRRVLPMPCGRKGSGHEPLLVSSGNPGRCRMQR